VSAVTQDWVREMPWKMQSIMLNGLRAPDAATKGVKKCVRWLRTQTCNDADPTKPDCYMSAPKISPELVEQAIDELEYLPCHYVHHFADAMRVVSIYHPDQETRDWAFMLHAQVAEEIFHFVPESKEQFIVRHRDKVNHA
jgi:hypothetical protein